MYVKKNRIEILQIGIFSVYTAHEKKNDFKQQYLVVECLCSIDGMYSF